MELGALSDAELIDLARQGSAPAFAALLHRHGPAVRATAANDPDPAGAVISTFVAAMRHLDTLPPDVPVRTWLLGLATDQVRDPAPLRDTPLPDLDPDERDEIWAELDLRWPDGRVPRHVPHWVGWAALVVALVALGVLVPYLAVTLGTGGDDDPTWDAIRAEPFADDEMEREPEPEELPEDDIEFELPSFELDEPDPVVEAEPPPPPPPPADDPPPVQDAPPVQDDPVVEEPVVEDEDDDADDDSTDDPPIDDDPPEVDPPEVDPPDDDPPDEGEPAAATAVLLPIVGS